MIEWSKNRGDMSKDGKSDEAGSIGGPADSMDSKEQLKRSVLEQLSEEEIQSLYIEKRLESSDLSDVPVVKGYLKHRLKQAIDDIFDKVIDSERRH